MFRSRCLDDVPATPDVFPRNSWLCLRDFELPIFGKRSLRNEACWAASEASLAWSKALNRPVRVHLDGTSYTPAPIACDTVIDATCFMLAVNDKVHEIVWYERHRQSFSSERLTFRHWTLMTDEVIEEVYLKACEALKITPGVKCEAPEFTDIYWFVRDALNLWSSGWKLRALPRPPPPGYLPFPMSVLGRFGAACHPRYYSVLKGRGDETDENIVELAPVPAPPPGRRVDADYVYWAAGLEAELAVKERYQGVVYAFFDNVELSDPPA